ncbi:MCE family protein [Streptomyces sp. NPDC054796]
MAKRTSTTASGQRAHPPRPRRPRRVRRLRLAALGVALALLGVTAAGAAGLPVAEDVGAGLGLGGDGKRITAYFDRAVSVHEGSDVRVLGVRTGSVESVRPRGRRVEVTLHLDEGVKVPANARAVVVAPSVVSGRYVQLAPAWTKGAQIQDGAVLPAERNATPLEVDELVDSLTGLSEALGPGGANKDGALSDLIGTGARNLDGNGKALGDTVEQLGSASKALAGSKGDLTGTIEELQKFTALLKKNDGKVRKSERQLSQVATFLADDKENLAAALKQLGGALGKVKDFIRDNRGELKTGVGRLAKVTDALVEQRASLAEALDTAPLAADNTTRAYNPRTGTIDGRADINELSMLPLPASGTPHSARGGKAGKGAER